MNKGIEAEGPEALGPEEEERRERETDRERERGKRATERRMSTGQETRGALWPF